MYTLMEMHRDEKNGDTEKPCVHAQKHTQQQQVMWSAATVATVQFPDTEHRWKDEVLPQIEKKERRGRGTRAGERGGDQVKSGLAEVDQTLFLSKRFKRHIDPVLFHTPVLLFHKFPVRKL